MTYFESDITPVLIGVLSLPLLSKLAASLKAARRFSDSDTISALLRMKSCSSSCLC